MTIIASGAHVAQGPNAAISHRAYGSHSKSVRFVIDELRVGHTATAPATLPGRSRHWINFFDALPEHVPGILRSSCPTDRLARNGYLLSRTRKVWAHRPDDTYPRDGDGLLTEGYTSRHPGGQSLSLYTRQPHPERLAELVLASIRRVNADAGWEATPRIAETQFCREEVCCWMERSAAARVLAKLPVLIKYAETLRWEVDPHSHEGFVLVRGLQLPDLTRGGDRQRTRPTINLDVKLYAFNRDQPPKLEFQAWLRRGRWMREQDWSAVRTSMIKVMDAFLEVCGVAETFIRPEQATFVTPLAALSDPSVVMAMQAAALRLDPQVKGWNYLPQRVQQLYGLGEQEKEVFKAILACEKRWIDFGRD